MLHCEWIGDDHVFYEMVFYDVMEDGCSTPFCQYALADEEELYN
jgi:hypothetical protein